MPPPKDDKAKRIPSDQPTALIAPSDYEHIFQGEEDDAKTKQQTPTPSKAAPEPSPAKRTPSDQPTALIAPSDYEHIFQGEDDPKEEKKKKEATTPTGSGAGYKGGGYKIPSDTPTALIAPSDFEHIYRDPTVFNAPKKAKVAKKESTKGPVKTAPSRFKPNQRESSSNLKGKGARASSTERRAPAGTSKAKSSTCEQPVAQEVLPPSIQNVVKKFIDKQKKTYTIKK